MRRTFALPLAFVLCLAPLTGCDLQALSGLNGNSTANTVTGTDYFPITDGALAEFRVSMDGVQAGTALATIDKIDDTSCYLKALTKIGDQEEGMMEKYQWNGSDLVATEQSGDSNPRTYTALKSSMKSGDSWTSGTETVRVVSVGSLDTPLGTIGNVARIDHLSNGKVFNSMWFAPDKGIVKAEFEPQGSTKMVTLEITKYTAQPTPINFTAAQFFPITATAQWSMDMYENGTKVGTASAHMALGNGSQGALTVAELTNGSATPNNHTETIDNASDLTATSTEAGTQIWLKYPCRVGSSWNVGTGASERTFVVAGFGSLETPFQTYSDVVRVVRMYQGKVEQCIWFAKDVGLVQMAMKHGDTQAFTLYKLTNFTP